MQKKETLHKSGEGKTADAAVPNWEAPLLLTDCFWQACSATSFLL
jgi:hypothetical protein